VVELQIQIIMTMVRILLVAALVVLGMAVVVLGLAPVAPEQALQAVEGALVGVAVAVVLVAVALARVLAEVPEEVQELEALVLQAAQAQAVRDRVVRDQVNLPPVRVKAEEDLFHLQEEEARLRAVVRNQEQSVGKKTQPRHQVGSLKARQMAMVVVKAAEEVKSKKAGKKK
jgi:hypothetical protein